MTGVVTGLAADFDKHYYVTAAINDGYDIGVGVVNATKAAAMKLLPAIKCLDVSRPESLHASELQLLPSGLLDYASWRDNHVHAYNVQAGVRRVIPATPVRAC